MLPGGFLGSEIVRLDALCRNSRELTGAAGRLLLVTVRCRHAHLAGLLAAVLPWGAAWTACAQDAGSDAAIAAQPPTMDGIVARLGSSDYAQREAAENELTLRPLSEILKALGDRSLSAEQRERLEQAGLTQFRDAERAALGVQFSQFNFGRGGAAGGGVTIERTIPGFDSTRVFQAGDIIRSMGGQTIRDQNEARPVIVSFEPGEEVDVEFVRGGEVMRDKVKLGSFRTLTNRGDLSGFQLQRAWEYRLARAAGGPPPAAPVPAMDPTRFRRVVNQERRASADLAREAAERLQANQIPETATGRGLNFVRAGAARDLTEDARSSFDADRINLKLSGKANLDPADATRERIRQLESQIRDNSLRLRNANLDDGTRARIEANNRQLRLLVQQNREDLRRWLQDQAKEEPADQQDGEGQFEPDMDGPKKK
jgi:hypothetical protein